MESSAHGDQVITSSTTSSLADVAREAFNDAVKVFNEKLTHDECKRIWLVDKADIYQVQQAVSSAKAAYEAKSKGSKARKWLSRLSSRVVFYSTVLDMMVQHHPEYVSLAWGTFKFFFIALVNHEEVLAQVSKALSQIADNLPRLELQAFLYQTSQMRQAVSTVFAHIVKFFQRAIDWYTQGKIRHIASAILNPFELRFKDLVDEIGKASRHVDQLAVAGAQLELRQMHSEQNNMRLLLLDLKRIILEHQTLNFRGFVDSKRRICEIQFSQILNITHTAHLLGPEESFRFCQFLSNRRRLRAKAESSQSWRSRKLQDWASSSQSSLILVKGTGLHRVEVEDFTTDIVSLLQNMQIPVVWILSTAVGGANRPPPVDVLKQLVLQVLRINHKLLDEQSALLDASRFQCAATEEQWFDLLTAALVGLPQIYIVIDVGILGQEFSSHVAWPTAFLKLFEELSKRCATTSVKVVLASSGSTPFIGSSLPEALGDATIRIDRFRRVGGAAKRKPLHRFPGAAAHRQGPTLLKPFILRSQTT